MREASQPVTFERALRIAGYNWPLYAGASIAIITGVILASATGLSPIIRIVGGVGAAIAA